MKKVFSAFLVLSTFLMGSIGFVAAQTPGNVQSTPTTGTPGNIQTSIPVVPAQNIGGTAKLENPINVDTFDELVERVIEAAVAVLTPFVVLAFVYSGFLFVKAQGNPEEITKAKTAITYSFIGAVILLGAYGFAQIIGETVTTITGQ